MDAKPNDRQPWFGREGQVCYFLRKGREPGGPIKIGFSANFERRYKEIWLQQRLVLVGLALIPGNRELEALLHQAFRPFALGHEWFLDLRDANRRLEAWCRALHQNDELIAQLPSLLADPTQNPLVAIGYEPQAQEDQRDQPGTQATQEAPPPQPGAQP